MPNSFKIDASNIKGSSDQCLLLQKALYAALSELSSSLILGYDAVNLEDMRVTTQKDITTFDFKDTLEQAARKTLSGAAARALVDRLTIKGS